ncbi:MAG: GAF domain-containing protein [candidate division NC10 bacterium]
MGLFHFQVLYNVLENIHYIYDESELANTILATISDALNAEGGSIFKILPDERIIPLAAYGASLEAMKKLEFKVGVGVVGWVAQYIQPVKVDNPRQDPRFMGMADKCTGFHTRSILAAPIITKGEIVVVIEFLNRKGGPFAAPDLELVSMVGREIGIAFENVRLIQSLEQDRAFHEAVVNSLSCAIIAVDKDGNLLSINPNAKRMLRLKYEGGEDVHPKISEALSAFPALVKQLEEVAASKTAKSKQSMVMRIADKERKIEWSSVPIVKKRDGKSLGAALIFHDKA